MSKSFNGLFNWDWVFCMRRYAEIFECPEVFSVMKTSEWNDLYTQNTMSTKMPDCPFLSVLSLLWCKIVLGTWIPIFSIFSKPWQISMLFVPKRRRNVTGMFFWSRLYPFFPGLCWYDWGGSSCCMSGVVNLSFSTKTLVSARIHCLQECRRLCSFPTCVLTEN